MVYTYDKKSTCLINFLAVFAPECFCIYAILFFFFAGYFWIWIGISSFECHMSAICQWNIMTDIFLSVTFWNINKATAAFKKNSKIFYFINELLYALIWLERSVTIFLVLYSMIIFRNKLLFFYIYHFFQRRMKTFLLFFHFQIVIIITIFFDNNFLISVEIHILLY